MIGIKLIDIIYAENPDILAHILPTKLHAILYPGSTWEVIVYNYHYVQLSLTATNIWTSKIDLNIFKLKMEQLHSFTCVQNGYYQPLGSALYEFCTLSDIPGPRWTVRRLHSAWHAQLWHRRRWVQFTSNILKDEKAPNIKALTVVHVVYLAEIIYSYSRPECIFYPSSFN